MDRVLRWSAVPAALLVLAITGCGGDNSPDGAPAAETPSRPETAASKRPPVPATEGATAARTAVLHVTGMMKSKSGAT